ncbi:MAG: flagellar motor protein MotB [Gammaproteobacteria bacterium]|nr:flagellar motor protein MotB [Gammaproteobacteria bacterium]MBU2407740.1 flagellar motor protein MotB [Gammaproteobacteria bacterium]
MKKLQPIIIKRVKKSAHAHHGGAWKIAYADFVTAMMAFFLLMWLLGSTAKGDLQGIASYFNSPLKVEMSGGPGSGSSSSIVTGGGKDLTRTTGEVRRSQSTEGKQSSPAADAESAKREKARQEARQDAHRLAELRDKMEALITANVRLREFRSQIRMQVTLDGLEIQIVDDQSRPMFDTGSALVKPYMRDILREIGTALNGIENRVSLAGHTDATPYGNGDRGYGNWELSADRANASRRELVAAGMPDDKLVRVVGLAASDLLEKESPRAAVNRRISITVLTREAASRMFGGGAQMEGNDAVKAITQQMALDAKTPPEPAATESGEFKKIASPPAR